MIDNPNPAVELRAELVVQIILRLQAIGLTESSASCQVDRAQLASLKGHVIRHDFTSDFEQACSVLQQTQAVSLSNSDGTLLADTKAWGPCFVLKYDMQSLRDHLGGLADDKLPTLEETIASFLALATCYGGNDRLSTSRKAHRPPAYLDRAVALLVKNGFAEKSGDEIIWTDQIGPMMQANYLWDERNVSGCDRAEALAHNVWSSMPERFRNLFFKAGEVDVIGLGFAIESYWYDGKWQKHPQSTNNRRRLPEPEALSLARALEARFKGRV